MGKLVAYEVQTYQRGDWRIDSIVEDRDMAMDSARQFERSKHCAGVRVVEEIHDEDSQQTATKIIYRHTKADAAQAATQRAKQAAPKPRPAGPRTAPGEFKPRAYTPPPKRDSGTTLAVVTLVVLGIVLAVGYYLTQVA